MKREFRLDPRLQDDTLPVIDFDLCTVRLMNDSRFPWLILVPACAGLEELDQLDDAQMRRLTGELRRCSRALHAEAAIDKLNVGALGNIVRQLHVHVVGRRIGDAAWPGPVWGAGRAEPYSAAGAAALVSRLAAALGGARAAR